MSSIKDKAIKTGLSVLIGGSLIFFGVDTARMIRQDMRVSLREQVYELVQQKYEGKYDLNIDGKNIRVEAKTFESYRPDIKNRCLYVGVKDEKDSLYFLDLAIASSVEDTFFGKLDACEGKVKSPEQEFDNYLKIVKEEMRKS